MEMKSNYLSNSHENYIRMLILFIPYLDYSFFFDDEIDKEMLKAKIIHALQRYGGYSSLDIVDSLIDFYYPEDIYTLNDFYIKMFEISKTLLTYHDNRLCIDMFESYDDKSFVSLFNNKVLDYLEISKLIPNSLLMAFYNVYYDYDLEYCIQRNLIKPISVVNHQLDLVLSKGIAETHTHVVGSIPFERQWNWLAHEIYDGNVDAERLLNSIEKNKGVLFQKNKYGYKNSLVHLIKHALTIRLIMVIYLTKLEEGYSLVTFEEFFKEIGNKYFNRKDINILYRLISSIENKKSYEEFNFKNIDYVLDVIKSNFYSNIDLQKEYINYEFNDEDNEDSFSKRLYKGLLKNYCCENECDLNEHIEYIFQHLSIKHIKNSDDTLFKRAFMYYCRVKNFIHSFITQSTDIKGFLEFQSFFRRQGTLFDIPSHMFTNIFKTYLYENVRFLEVRIGHVKFKNSSEKNGLNLIYGQENELREIFYRTILNFVLSYKKYLQGISDVYKREIPHTL